VRFAVSDTGPVNYLILLGHVGILPVLFEKIVIPSAVHSELNDVDTPAQVRSWIASPPGWISVWQAPVQTPLDPLLASLDPGEREAIRLSFTHNAICC